MKNIDYTSIFTYLPLAIYGLIIASTSLYLTEVHTLVPPFVIASGILFILMVYMMMDGWKHINKNIDVLPAVTIWTFYLAYGLIFRHVGTSVTDVLCNISAAVVLVIVISTYKIDLYDNYSFRVFMVLLYAILSLFTPSPDVVAIRANFYLTLFKISLFYFLYILCSSESIVMGMIWKTRAMTRRVTTSTRVDISLGGEENFYTSTERKIIQSSWVLFSSWYFIIFAMLQVAALVWWVNKYYKDNPTYGNKRDDDDYHTSSGGISVIMDIENGSFSNTDQEGVNIKWQLGENTSRMPIILALPPPKASSGGKKTKKNREK